MVKTRNWHQLKNKGNKVDSTVKSMCVLSYIFLRGTGNVNINPVFVRSHHSQTIALSDMENINIQHLCHACSPPFLLKSV